jgi:hypothetical protein
MSLSVGKYRSWKWGKQVSTLFAALFCGASAVAACLAREEVEARDQYVERLVATDRNLSAAARVRVSNVRAAAP